MSALRIGQIGWGTVGSAFGRLVAEGPMPFELSRLAVRDATRARDARLPGGVELVSPDEVARDVDVVVELAGGTNGPARWASATLEAGIPYVTANKALLATCGGELAATARRTGAALLASASVGGGTPMIETLSHLSAAGGVERIRGILNATTNYILGRMGEGVTYDEALREAQEAGYAEADPSFDVDGRDAAQKLAILASVAWRRWRAEREVETEGIAGLRAGGEHVRLVAGATPDRMTVAPTAIEPGSALATVEGIQNLLEIHVAGGSVIRISGPGAGGDVSARAVYADVARIAAGERPVLFA
ncbi:MAG: homoserine dehydrogenase [Candidatus Limnocylindria bacterium]